MTSVALKSGAGWPTIGAGPVGLVDHEDVRDLQDPGLGRLDAVAHPGREQHQRGVGEPGDLDLALADPDGLDDHHVVAVGPGDGEGVEAQLPQRPRGTHAPARAETCTDDGASGQAAAYAARLESQRCADHEPGNLSPAASRCSRRHDDSGEPARY